MLEIKIKKLVDTAVIPSYAHNLDAGMDLTAVSKKVVDGNVYGYVSYGIGIAIEIPEGYVGLIFPRSSISKTGMILANAVGVIDSGYKGEIECRFKHISKTIDYNINDKVAQLIIIPIPKVSFVEVDDLSETDRGVNGFGSTDVVV